VYRRFDVHLGHHHLYLRTPNAADSPRTLYQVHSPRKHQDLYYTLRFEVFTAMFQVQFFWVMRPCSVVVGYQRFRETRCPPLQGSNLPQHYMASRSRRTGLESYRSVIFPLWGTGYLKDVAQTNDCKKSYT
jgi:hypothetical protein